MAQFHVYRLRDGALVMDCQSDSLSHLSTRVVAPLLPTDRLPKPNPRLHPIFTIDETGYVLATHLLATVQARDLVRPLLLFGERRYEIVSALDLVITGV